MRRRQHSQAAPRQRQSNILYDCRQDGHSANLRYNECDASQQVITKDNETAAIDGVLFFLVTDIEKAVILVQDFAFANQMGVHMARPGVTNWGLNTTFTKSVAHRIVNDVPAGTLTWRLPSSSEEQSWNSTAAPTGTPKTDIEHNGAGYGMDAIDPNGVAVILPDPVTGAVNLFGSNCLLAGFALIP